jgi:hypothetical protein
MSDMPNGAAVAAPDSGAAPAAPTPAPAPEAITHTDREVAGALAKMLDGDDDSDTTESPEVGDESTSEDVGADESPPTDDEPDSEPEASDRTPIEPPAGWNGKDRETWQSLPPAVQETIRRRDSEMAAAVSRAGSERAEIERTATARLEQAIQDRAQYQQTLAVIGQAMLPRARELASTNWTQVAAENPAEYVRLSAEYNELQQKHQQIQGEVQRIQYVAEQEAAQRKEQQRRISHQRLVEDRPEFADPQKAQEIGSRLGQFLRSQGFADQEIIDCIDDRAIKLALKAMEAEERVSNVARANAKRVPTPAPQVQRPGSSRPGASNGSRMTQLADRFDKAPTVENAARIVAQWLQ